MNRPVPGILAVSTVNIGSIQVFLTIKHDKGTEAPNAPPCPHSPQRSPKKSSIQNVQANLPYAHADLYSKIVSCFAWF